MKSVQNPPREASARSLSSLYVVSTSQPNTQNVVVELQHKVPGAAQANVVALSTGRHVVWLTVDGSLHRGALSAAASYVIATAADTARTKGIPLVVIIELSGA